MHKVSCLIDFRLLYFNSDKTIVMLLEIYTLEIQSKIIMLYFQ